MSSSVAALITLVASLTFVACGDGASSTTTSSGTGGASATATVGAATSTSASSGTGTGGAGGAKPDVCGNALLCEKFDDYPGVAALSDNQTLGPWKAALKTPGATMGLDGTHTTSGNRALHMHIDTAATAGGRLFADGAKPIFQGNPTHIYGRMMMYIDPNGPSIHWTFFGASGNAEPGSPVTGRRATYLMSSLPKNDVNTYSFVYGLDAQGSDPYHDCYFQSTEPMKSPGWTCIAFEMDSVTRKLRMINDGAASPTVALDDHGQGCVGTVVPGNSPWYGPAIDQLYVGAWSFHDMVSPLDVWIDDLVVDTEPVSCPPP